MTSTVTLTATATDSPQRVLRLHPDNPTRDLEENGYTVVRGVLTPERAEDYRQRAYDWLEKMGPNFKRNDRNTWHVKNLPPHEKGGMYQLAGIGHEQFLWDLRCEQAVIDVFATIWGTDELLVSFDGVNLALPLPEDQYHHRGKPWPHVQGIVALVSPSSGIPFSD
ncbi:hypothetical protein JCM24511_06126 [Saitozyma sp. JCM 24511]|nr:hypothetical protein JCM24511_06126 [Saitozyma sp. JCM 24511]